MQAFLALTSYCKIDARAAADFEPLKRRIGSSDGNAKGMTAPLPAGQLRAMHRAYAQAGHFRYQFFHAYHLRVARRHAAETALHVE